MIDDPDLPPVGVFREPDGLIAWRVWAPRAQTVELEVELDGPARRMAMTPEARGYFFARVATTAKDIRYGYSLDGGPLLPDPLSRHQPDGIRGLSAVDLADSFPWTDANWPGIPRGDLVFYELHVGTFTTEGTFDAILPRLESLKELGITAIELMPIGQFPGSRSWGYDGVFPFAPQNSYGGPTGLKRLVDACHARGLAVFLDVIYNHLGPEGNVFPEFGPYFTDRYKTDWGSAVNYDGAGSDSVRAVVLENVKMWIGDYHVDGLRLDAADQIYDHGPRHILSEIAEMAHREAARLGRPVHVFAETDLNDAPKFLHQAEHGGYGLDGHWNDDFHHAAHVILTGETNGYYADFASAGPKGLAKVFERVFVNDGNFSLFRDRRHGASAIEFAADRFVAFVQNHDQVGNRLQSDRYAASLPREAVRLAAGLLLLAPRLPLLFMGEEYGETNPFPFFCDFDDPELIRAVREGRKAEFAHFGWDREQPDPVAPATRDLAVLSWSWAEPDRAELRELYRDLLTMRRNLPALRNFQHPRTVLHDSETVLEVIRGGSVPELSIVFNLTGSRRPMPIKLDENRLVFRSERLVDNAETLFPFEFAIFERRLG